MIEIISRAPNDKFTFDLFHDLVSSLNVDYEAYYLWATPPYQFQNFVQQTKFSQPNVILGIKDLLDLWQDYNFWQDTAQAGVQLLDKMALQWPHTNFVIFTSLENITGEHMQATNIQFVPWGGDITNQAQQYPKLEPVLSKDFSSSKTYISLNRNIRAHRIVLLSYLFGKNLDQHGHITYLGQQIDTKNIDNLLDCMSWEFEPRHDADREAMLAGYTKFYNNKMLSEDSYEIYDRSENDNIENFNRRLRSKYQHSFVELVTESSFSSPGYLITEKTLNSVYACNFPIVFSGTGAVAHLRQLGLDMFDDVIDHSYDLVANPFDRIIRAIENNRQLLLDTDHAKQQWKQCQKRFEQNIAVAQKPLYEFYQRRARDIFTKLIWA